MGKINLLSFEVANLIAAGEVVDRPSSAVKELLENAVDAGAGAVTLEIQRGGVSFIRVTDNGCGIEKDDLIPAVTRHSTSKIHTAADLDSILTLGFRGEALAAIASVSRLRIFSKIPGQGMGAVLTVEGGQVVSVEDTGCADGTTVIAEDLFYNVPARRKFLKKDSTEGIAIGAVVEKIALSHPEVSLSCEIVYKVLRKEGLNELTLDIATCIYTGLMTDTGNFSYNSTNPDLYDIIADLLRAGVQKDEIYNAVFNQYSSDRQRLMGYALYRKMRIYPEYHLALITFTADELDQFHYQNGDCEGIVNLPLQIADVYYSVCMREERAKPGTPKSRIRISLRSQGDRPVNIWANEVFHGGGHMNASGGELLGSIPYAVKIFEQSYSKYLKK